MQDLDEALYSRQLYVLGHAAMLRMRNTDVLVVGGGSLSFEICKNIVLAGVRSLAVFEDENSTRKEHKVAMFANVAELAALNSNVQVSSIHSLSDISRFAVVVAVQQLLSIALDLNSRATGAFVHCQSRGLFSAVFTDFKTVHVLDDNGETPLEGIVAAIAQDGLVAVLDEHRYLLYNGDMASPMACTWSLKRCVESISTHSHLCQSPLRVRIHFAFHLSCPAHTRVAVSLSR